MSLDVNKRKMSMLLLVLYPIIGVYSFPFLFGSWGDFLFIVLIILDFIRNQRKIIFGLPMHYGFYWGYLSISYLVLSHFKPASFIPGGLSFFVFSLILGYVIKYFDYRSFKKYYRVVFFITALIFMLQELSYIIVGHRFSMLLPYGTVVGGTPVTEIIQQNISGDRSSSIFREPAHFAQFVLPLLAMELFDKEGIGRKMNKYALIIILLLLFLRSGNGIAGLLVLTVFKLANVILYEKNQYKLIGIIFFSTFVVIGMSYYMSTETGELLLYRTQELSVDENSNSFIRLYRGYYVYNILPPANKVFGISPDDLPSVIKNSSVSFLFSGENDTYYNGIHYVLLYSGIIGLLLILLVYLGLFRHNSPLGKSVVLLLLGMALVAGVYGSYTMLCCTSLSESEKRLRLRGIKNAKYEIN